MSHDVNESIENGDEDALTSEAMDDAAAGDKIERKRARMVEAFDVMGFSLQAGHGNRCVFD